ncbi:uncharacterized protein LOC121381034 [Gigantopelta aegis]|uniref:uncharacterized protein LOC121381034 n=1 Tax=Gigantopelta aegis TaxID=1735272 RepID=UPI001B888FD0|nr:uncharacterized protein LOC121381034 [Gigantopelta aegis]
MMGQTLQSAYDRVNNSMTDTRNHPYGQVKPTVDVYGFDDSSTCCVTLCENGAKTYSIVSICYQGRKPELKCHSGKLVKCMHVNAILDQDGFVSDISTKFLKELNVLPQWRSRYVPVSVSEKPIPFSCLPEEQKTNRHSWKKSSKDGFIHLVPPVDGLCTCGCSWSDSKMWDTVKIFSENDIFSAKVYFRPCSNELCQGMKEYDGGEDQLLNMGTYLISHSVFFKELHETIPYSRVKK